MNGNGHKEATEGREQIESGQAMLRRVKQRVFPHEFLTPGTTIAESLAKAVIADEQKLIDAILYIGKLERLFGADDPRLRQAMYKIIGSPAIDGRARDEAVQAFVDIFYPRHASSEDKKRLEKMQFQRNHQNEEDEKPTNQQR